MNSENRRALFEALVERAQRNGFVFEEDPGFRASVEEWITGAIEIDELRGRYSQLVEMRRRVRTLGNLGEP